MGLHWQRALKNSAILSAPHDKKIKIGCVQ